MANDSGLFRTRDQLEHDGWTLTGNVFVRGSERMLRYTRPRWSITSIIGSAPTKARPKPRLTWVLCHDLHQSSRTTQISWSMPRYWVQDFDTLDEQKSKPGKPVYDHGVTSRLEAKHGEHDWLLGWRDICRSTDERTVICSTSTSRSGRQVSPCSSLASDT